MFAYIVLKSCERIMAFLDTMLSLPTGAVVSGFRVGNKLYFIIGGSGIVSLIVAEDECVRSLGHFCFKRDGKVKCVDTEPRRSDVGESDVVVIYDVDEFSLLGETAFE